MHFPLTPSVALGRSSYYGFMYMCVPRIHRAGQTFSAEGQRVNVGGLVGSIWSLLKIECSADLVAQKKLQS